MKSIFSVFEAACVAGVIALGGCDSQSHDSGAPGASLGGQEAGLPAGADAGVPASDPGVSATDAGVSGADAGCADTDAGCAAPMPDETQLPAIGDDATISAWLDKGYFKAWHCESAPHDPRPPGAHGKDRICSNTLLSTHGAGEYPVGSAGVKELYDDAGANVIGHALYRKMSPGKGDAWYWYEKVDGTITGNGLGNAGAAKSVCVRCHSTAGTGMNFGHDFVFTQVK